MNKKAEKIILESFCRKQRLSLGFIPPGLSDMICAVTAPYLLMIECLDKLENDPTNGLLIKLIDRTYQTAAGALALIAIGHPREAEILSRSIYESAVTTAYIVNKTPSLRLAQFFRAYVKQERDQNRKWANDTGEASGEVQKDHLARIESKNLAMDCYEQIIDQYIAHCRIDPEESTNWPGLIDRCTELGRRLEYRTIYAAMCSQSHHDAEDVINHFVANTVPTEGDFANQMEREADAFSIWMVLFGLKSFVDAVMAVCSHFNFSTVVSESVESLERIIKEIQVVSWFKGKNKLPKSWELC